MLNQKLIKNKLAAGGLIALGLLAALIGKDATALIFLLVIGAPLFFAKENWINGKGERQYESEKNKRKSVWNGSYSSRKTCHESRNTKAIG